LIIVAAGFMLSSLARANVTWTWDFSSPTNGGVYTPGSSGLTGTFGAGAGHSITAYAAQETTTGPADPDPPGVPAVTGTISLTSTSTLNGLFQVNDNPNNNGKGIAPYDPTFGNSNSFGNQLGLSDDTGTNLSNLLLINLGAVTNNESLTFLLNAGVTGDSFNVWTFYGASTPTSLADGGTAMTERVFNQSVGTMGPGNGSVQPTSPQAMYTTTQAGNLWLAIQADCHYLLLDQIGASQPTATPEPRFYGFLLASLLGVAGMIYRKRQATA
jgi:hypothetical protein